MYEGLKKRRCGSVMVIHSLLLSSSSFLSCHPSHSSTFPSHAFHFSLSSRSPDVSVESAHFNLFCLKAINGQIHIHTNTCAHTDMHSFTQSTFSLSHHDTNSPSLSSLFSHSVSPLPPLSLDLSLFSLSTLAPLSLANTNEHLQAHFTSHTYTHTNTHTERGKCAHTHTHTQAGCLVSSWLLGSALLLLFLSIPSFNIVCLCTHM